MTKVTPGNHGELRRLFRACRGHSPSDRIDPRDRALGRAALQQKLPSAILRRMAEKLPTVIVCDAVGTLIYPAPPVSTVYAAVGRRCGSRLSEAEVATRFRDVFHDVERRDRRGDLRTSEQRELARWQEIVRRVLDDVADHSAAFAELFDHFARPGAWRVFDDVPNAVDGLLSRGARLAIASNFDERLVDIARSVKPLDRFDPVLVSSQIGYRKPHRRFFEAVAAVIAAPAHDVLFVGDDPANDTSGAAAVGFRTRLIVRQQSSHKSDATISSLAELLD